MNFSSCKLAVQWFKLRLKKTTNTTQSLKPKLFQTRKLRRRLLLLGIANNVPNWSLDCDLVSTGRVGGTPATTRAADEVMADPHHLLQTGQVNHNLNLQMQFGMEQDI